MLDETFSYGYDGSIYNLRSSSESAFYCYYKKASRMPSSFKEECIKVCYKISDYARKQNRIPIVLLSGGLDSEVIVRAFIDSGREFKIVSNRFLNQLNSHEIDYIEKLVKEKNLDIDYIDVDIEKAMYSKKYLEMAEISKCAYSEMLPTMDLIETVYSKMNGIPILGNGDFYSTVVDNKWMYVEFEYILAWYRYSIRQNIPAAVNFYQQTSEIILSMALDPIIQQTISQHQMPNVRLAKYHVYKKYWNDADIRPKFNGAEKIQQICDDVNDNLLKQNKIYTTKWIMPTTKFIEMILPY